MSAICCQGGAAFMNKMRNYFFKLVLSNLITSAFGLSSRKTTLYYQRNECES